jgi:hypothetical protein
MCGLFSLLAYMLEDEWGWPAMLGLKWCHSVTYSVYLNSTDTRLELVNGFRTYEHMYTENINPSSLLCLVG